MSSTQPRSATDVSSAALACPAWCVTRHGDHLGEEDWLHSGEPLDLGAGMRASVVMSVDPSSGVADGPHVLIGGQELSLVEARRLGLALVAAVDAAASAQLQT